MTRLAIAIGYKVKILKLCITQYKHATYDFSVDHCFFSLHLPALFLSRAFHFLNQINSSSNLSFIFHMLIGVSYIHGYLRMVY